MKKIYSIHYLDPSLLSHPTNLAHLSFLQSDSSIVYLFLNSLDVFLSRTVRLPFRSSFPDFPLVHSHSIQDPYRPSGPINHGSFVRSCSSSSSPSSLQLKCDGRWGYMETLMGGGCREFLDMNGPLGWGDPHCFAFPLQPPLHFTTLVDPFVRPSRSHNLYLNGIPGHKVRSYIWVL